MENTVSSTIKLGIVGYGNLGRGVEMAIRQNADMELVAIFTRRSPKEIKTETLVESIDNITTYVGKIDVLLLCGGSASDLPIQVLEFSKLFNTVDSFDTHAKIPEYFESVNECTKANKRLSLISTGWDPGLFSMLRLIGQSVLPQGEDYTFWGEGLSQGHSDAIRRIEGVKGGVQYTIPLEEAIAKVKSGENPILTTAEKHERVCYVVTEQGADQEKIAHTIKTMPNYFADYKTTVHFIAEEELATNHSKMPHGGIVFRSGITGEDTKQRIEFHLQLDSNPEFTSSVLVAFSRAIYKMAKEGQTGARTVFDIPLGYLSAKSPEELRATLL
ncbi:MAG: diaminopimelate dehydrogenase [Flavobacteriaceae bacterium]|jgi:diaminopimelate dehydrogenase|nr:diaminopimelate dehydrogenase [Flavobacteriaceae bacterium]